MNILIIGGGAMGQSIVKGILQSSKAHSCVVVERNAERVEIIDELGVKVSTDVESAFKDVESNNYDVCLIAVKPVDLADLGQQLKGLLPSSCVLISIAAGVSIEVLQHNFGDVGIVRAMPNIAASKLSSATAYCLGTQVTETQLENAKEILTSFGSIVRVAEDELNLVTAVSGNGPAYFFLMAEQLLSAAINQGMDSEIAQQLVSETFIGAAKMANDQGSFKTLRESVTSPGGTTEAAIAVFNDNGFNATVSDAITAALRRAEDLNSSNHGKD